MRVAPYAERDTCGESWELSFFGLCIGRVRYAGLCYATGYRVDYLENGMQVDASLFLDDDVDLPSDDDDE